MPMEALSPKSWPIRCPECGDRIEVELPADAEPGRTGSAACRRNHPIVFVYDGVTVARLELAVSE